VLARQRVARAPSAQPEVGGAVLEAVRRRALRAEPAQPVEQGGPGAAPVAVRPGRPRAQRALPELLGERALAVVLGLAPPAAKVPSRTRSDRSA
jgi:hypothetical protein